MTAGGGKDASLGRGRTLAVPAFAEDDGTADPRVRHLLASSEDPIRLARALRSVRLLGCVIAVADEVDASGAEQSSHMAAVLMVNERGETGLLAFTGVDSLAAWNPQARPVPSLGREVARSALADAAQAVVLDVAGPLRVVVTGAALRVLADDVDLATVATAVREALTSLTAEGAADVAVAPAAGASPEADVLVTITAADGDHHRSAMLAAQLLAQRPDVQQLAPGGIAVTYPG